MPHASDLRKKSVEFRARNKELATAILLDVEQEVKDMFEDQIGKALENGKVSASVDLAPLLMSTIINEKYNVPGAIRTAVLRDCYVGVKLYIITEEGGYPGCSCGREDSVVTIHWGGGIIKPLT